MSVEIRHRYTGAVLYTYAWQTVREAVVEAIRAGSDLRGSDLSGSDLSGSNLSGSNLRGSDLRNSNLSDSDLRGSNLRHRITPETGAFEGWKKLSGGVIAHIRIPADAARIGGLVGRKCRAERVEVIALFGAEEGFTDTHGPRTVYRVGETVVPDSWDPDERVECSHGIHFFISRAEAEAYVA